MFSTNINSLIPEKNIIQKYLYNVPNMDSPNVSNIIMKYIHPSIKKRFLFSIDLCVDWIEEVQRYEPYPIDFKFILLAVDKVEAANMIENIIKERWNRFYHEFDITINDIINKLIKINEKNFYTFEPVLLFHSECQFTDEIIYKFSKNKHNNLGSAGYSLNDCCLLPPSICASSPKLFLL
jgi:hypothetical protein